jgi:hypothetical protein
MKLTTHLPLVSRVRMRAAIPPLPISLHDIVIIKYRGKFTFTRDSKQAQTALQTEQVS